MKTNSKGFAPILIILIVLAIIGGTYYLSTLKNKFNPISVVPFATPSNSTPTISPTGSPAAIWKTYTTSYGFTIQYPSDWSMGGGPELNTLVAFSSPETEQIMNTNDKVTTYNNMHPTNQKALVDIWPDVVVGVYYTGYNPTTGANNPDYNKFFASPLPTGLSEKDSPVGAVGFKMVTQGLDYPFGSHPYPSYLTRHNNIYFDVSFPNLQINSEITPLEKQILSTFKFTQ